MKDVEAIGRWSSQIRAGNTRAISRAITAIENRDPSAQVLLGDLFAQTGGAFVIGVTGAPGTGKSTLVDRLAAEYRRRGKTVGVIAVDPTSPFTGGAILGDRIRMQGHAVDEGVFIRSMATRGFLGGLSRAAADAVLLLDAAGKQIILIETVGVGQDEVDIVRLADCTLVLLVPGLGDEVQSMKAGLMEIADIFVLNKAEREGADRLARQIEAMLHLAERKDGWAPPILRTTATEGTGIAELIGTIEQFREQTASSGKRQARSIEHWRQQLVALLEEHLAERALASAEGERALSALAAEVAERKKSPYDAVRELASRI
jgi:LAO/AO transport system kinase